MSEVYAMTISRRKFLEVGALSTTGIVSSSLAYPQVHSERTSTPIKVDTQNLLVVVDPAACRWSAQVKGTTMQLNDVHFLPNDDPSGWKVVSAVNKADDNKFGSFVTVTLHGTKPGQLDFDYQLSVSKLNNDILVSLGRANNTGRPINIDDMDYFVSTDALLSGTTDKWISLGTHSRNRDYYKLLPVREAVTPAMYAVNHVIRDADSGNSLLMGHVTALKGASRFEVRQGWEDKSSDRMSVRGYCNYKITMPAGKAFVGEKLLIHFSSDPLRAMEHQADLIAVAHDVRLKQRRPIDLDDREWVSENYCRYHGWMSGGTVANARKFVQEHNLDAYYIGGLTGYGPSGGGFALYGSGGAVHRVPNRINFPAECYLPIGTPRYESERVIDFSNPVAIKLENERAVKWASTDSQRAGWCSTDFSDYWDKWPGQYDPYLTSLETYRIGTLPWREVIDKIAPRRAIRSNMNAVDHSYGIVDICRISEDADRGYEYGASALLPPNADCQFVETVMSSANRFFYNGRVFWNDGDGFHVYKYVDPDGKNFNYSQAKVVANFRSIADNTILVSEAFDEPYPEDRIELLKRVSPPTMDVAYPVDLFIRQPAQIWNMPVERPFGNWNVVGVFNYTHLLRVERLSNSLVQMLDGTDDTPFTTELDAAKDLRLDPSKEYVVYEFWSKSLLGTFRGTFKPRLVKPYDCDVYAIVEKQDHPVLLSTSRHVRQMAFDIKDLAYDSGQRVLSGVSRAVAGDPYQLRIYVPDGFSAQRVQLSDGLSATMKTKENLFTADYVSTTGKDVTWKIFF